MMKPGLLSGGSIVAMNILLNLFFFVPRRPRRRRSCTHLPYTRKEKRSKSRRREGAGGGRRRMWERVEQVRVFLPSSQLDVFEYHGERFWLLVVGRQ